MNTMPLVSVITIFLNEEHFIQEAIESVLAQTFDNWELILVDDGSTDGSTEIARRCATEHPKRVRYLEHPGHQNRGMSASRNLGICKATGNYIAFLDADDMWMPNKLEQQVAILEVQPEAAIVYGPAQWWYSWTDQPEDRARDYIHELGVPPDTLVWPPDLLTLFLRNEDISPCTCSVLVRRGIVERVGGFEETFPDMYEDQVFFAKICLDAPVFISRDCSAKYRQHPNSSCSVAQKTARHYAARATFLNWLATYLSRRGITDPDVQQALQGELRLHRHPILNHLMQRARQSVLGDAYRAARNLRTRWASLPVIRQFRCLRFRRLRPIREGRQHGTAIVRYWWARYLEQHQSDIRGHALEVGTTATIRQYGGQAVTRADAIDLEAYSPEITVVADLSRADHVPSSTYDCFVNQFTMHLVYDVEAALYHAIRILKPGGVLLVNFPCVDYYFARGLDMGTGAPLFLYWWFTPIQVENLLRRVGLAREDYQVDIYGNLFARIAYQMNVPAEELTRRELEYVDFGHPLLICARIVRPMNWQPAKPEYRNPWLPEGAPARWNPVMGHYAM
jgi:glycosyltransferase involved in cell wall biosynthesis/SAM-dependent methyltransferase